MLLSACAIGGVQQVHVEEHGALPTLQQEGSNPDKMRNLKEKDSSLNAIATASQLHQTPAPFPSGFALAFHL